MGFEQGEFKFGLVEWAGRMYLGTSQTDPQYVEFTLVYRDANNPPTKAQVDAMFDAFCTFLTTYPGAVANPQGHSVDAVVRVHTQNTRGYPTP